MKSRRRRLIVDKEMQSRLIMAASWPAALCLAVTVTLLGVFCARVTHQMLEADIPLDGVLSLLVMSLVFMVVCTGYFLFNTLKISNRVFGPIFRLTDTLHRVRDGELDVRARLRDQDYLHAFANELNEFLDHVTPYLPRKTGDGSDEEKAAPRTGAETASPTAAAAATSCGTPTSD